MASASAASPESSIPHKSAATAPGQTPAGNFVVGQSLRGCSATNASADAPQKSPAKFAAHPPGKAPPPIPPNPRRRRDIADTSHPQSTAQLATEQSVPAPQEETQVPATTLDRAAPLRTPSPTPPFQSPAWPFHSSNGSPQTNSVRK